MNYPDRNLPDYRERKNLASRARKLRAPIVEYFTRREIAERDGWACYLCGETLTEETATLDHVVSLSNGGCHSLSNAKLACDECNNKKGNRSLEEFLKAKTYEK